MLNMIRTHRLKDIEVWEIRFTEFSNISCYVSIMELKKDTDNTNYISLDIHTNIDLKKTIDYEEFIMHVESLVENMMLDLEIEIKLHVYQVTLDKMVLLDEEEYVPKKIQELTYIDEFIENKCQELIKLKTNIELEGIKSNHFCQN